jgi:hypothetical protein
VIVFPPLSDHPFNRQLLNQNGKRFNLSEKSVQVIGS